MTYKYCFKYNNSISGDVYPFNHTDCGNFASVKHCGAVFKGTDKSENAICIACEKGYYLTASHKCVEATFSKNSGIGLLVLGLVFVVALFVLLVLATICFCRADTPGQRSERRKAPAHDFMKGGLVV